MDDSLLADMASEDVVTMQADVRVKRSREEMEAEEDEISGFEVAENSIYLNKPAKRAKIVDSVEQDGASSLSNCDNALDLPPEIMLKVFLYLSFVDLSNCGLVCHQWKAISSDDALWKRLYYEVWGTSAKTWKQLFASHYPEHEEIDMQQLVQQVTKMQSALIGARRSFMGLYRLDKSYVGKDQLRYPTLYRDIWALSSSEVKSIVANEVVLTARAESPLSGDVTLHMQQFGASHHDWKEITSYDRAQNIFWELLRYEGENEKKTWMEEEEANSCTEWLFGYFPFRKLSPRQLQAIRTRKALEKQSKRAAQEERERERQQQDEAALANGEGEEEEEGRAGNNSNRRVVGAGVIVGVGEMIEDEVEEEEEEDEDADYAMESSVAPTISASTSTSTSTTAPTTVTQAFSKNVEQLEEGEGEEEEEEFVSMVEEVGPSSAPVQESGEGSQPSEDIQIEMDVVTPSEEPSKAAAAAAEVITHEGQQQTSAIPAGDIVATINTNTNNSDDLSKEEIVLDEEEEEVEEEVEVKEELTETQTETETAPAPEEVVVIFEEPEEPEVTAMSGEESLQIEQEQEQVGQEEQEQIPDELIEVETTVIPPVEPALEPTPAPAAIPPFAEAAPSGIAEEGGSESAANGVDQTEAAAAAEVAVVGEEVGQRGRSQVARFFHTGAIKAAHGTTFVYGFAAISSSRFCTFWVETLELDEEIPTYP